MIEQRKDPERGSKETKKPIKKERRTDERRKLKSKGYTYISMVGWMDRRENKRRNNDSFEF